MVHAVREQAPADSGVHGLHAGRMHHGYASLQPLDESLALWTGKRMVGGHDTLGRIVGDTVVTIIRSRATVNTFCNIRRGIIATSSGIPV
jgi:hypothetical protein